MLARPSRAAAVAAVSVAALLSSACVRGRNDGGLDAAGRSGNGAGPAPQPGPLAGQNRDTSMIAPVSVGPAAGPAGAQPTPQAPVATPARPTGGAAPKAP